MRCSHSLLLIVVLANLLVLVGCSTRSAGGYYGRDGPPEQVSVDIASIPDAQPRDEPLRLATLKPYTVFGVHYQPMQRLARFSQTGHASWYGKQFHGRKTASGEIYDMFAMTAAHPTLPIPSYVRVTNLRNGRQVIVRVNDRGPFIRGRIIDLSYAAAAKLGFIQQGATEVKLELVLPGDYHSSERQRNEQRDRQTRPEAEPELQFDPKPDSDSDPKRQPEVKPEPPSEPTASSSALSLFLQLGAFSQLDNAQAALLRIQSMLPEEASRLTLARSGDLVRIRLGPFRDREALLAKQNQLERSLGLKSVVIPPASP